MPKPKPATDVRDAITGKFAPKSKAKTDPATTVTTRRKPKGQLGWAIQSIRTGSVLLHRIAMTRQDARLMLVGLSPKRWRVVRVEVQVVE